MKQNNEPKRFEEKHYSPAELAKAWSFSAEMIRQLFRDEPGVLKIGTVGYITLRIPASVPERVHNSLSAVARKI
jgi:hypothetical protein